MQGLIDVHCHIVPGVDDGAQTVYEAAKLLQAEYHNGVSAVIVTPHYRKGMFEPTKEEVERQFRKVWKLARRSRSGMRVYLGCEYHSNRDMVRDFLEEKQHTMIGTKYILTEFSARHSYDVLRNQIYELVAAGFKPIIAHAERYPCLLKEPTLVKELIVLGAEIQLSANAILGADGRKEKRFCWNLLKKRQVRYVGSDMHDVTERTCRLQECARVLEKKFGEEYVRQLMIRNPMRIIKEGRKNR